MIHSRVEDGSKKCCQAVNPLDQQQEIYHVGHGLPPAQLQDELLDGWIKQLLQGTKMLGNFQEPLSEVIIHVLDANGANNYR